MVQKFLKIIKRSYEMDKPLKIVIKKNKAQILKIRLYNIIVIQDLKITKISKRRLGKSKKTKKY